MLDVSLVDVEEGGPNFGILSPGIETAVDTHGDLKWMPIANVERARASEGGYGCSPLIGGSANARRLSVLCPVLTASELLVGHRNVLQLAVRPDGRLDPSRAEPFGELVHRVTIQGLLRMVFEIMWAVLDP